MFVFWYRNPGPLKRELQLDSLADTKRQQELFANWTRKLNILQRSVKAREKGKLKTRRRVVKTILAPLLAVQKQAAISRYRKFSNATGQSWDELIPLADRSFCLDEQCNGCGTCTRICPVGNIKMVDNKPVWQHHCETC